MSACEKCWGDAYVRAQIMGGSQADHYRDLLAANTDHDECRLCPALTVRDTDYCADHQEGRVG